MSIIGNFDSFTIVAETKQSTLEDQVSPSCSFREVFKVWNISRDENKAAEGVLSWSSLGAEQLGSVGLVGSM